MTVDDMHSQGQANLHAVTAIAGSAADGAARKAAVFATARP